MTTKVSQELILIRGGGDLASGVALRLHHVGIQIVITELKQPVVIRRSVSFAEAIYQGETQVEDVTAVRVDSIPAIESSLQRDLIPVLVDPECRILDQLKQSPFQVKVLIDGRMTKRAPYLSLDSAPLVIGLGPGFVAGENCHAVIETNRGHHLGRVIWKGSPLPDTGIPEGFGGHFRDRVLRAPANGEFLAHAEICDQLNSGDLIAEVAGEPIIAPFDGVLRGLLHSGLWVEKGFKVGDIDPRNDPSYCRLVSDKSLAIAGGVLEAILASRNYWTK